MSYQVCVWYLEVLLLSYSYEGKFTDILDKTE